MAKWKGPGRGKGMGGRRGRSIYRTQLYAQLSTMLLSLLLVTLVYLRWQAATLRADLRSALEQTGRTVALGVDMELQRMDSLSINILYSNLVKESMTEYFSTHPRQEALTVDSAYARNTNAENLTNLMISIMGADRPVTQINLYNSSGGCFGTGKVNGFQDWDVRELDWYPEALEKAGQRTVTRPARNPMLAAVRPGGDQLYLSLVRQYFDTYNQPQGFVEIIQGYSTVFATAEHPESVYEPGIYVYDTAGAQVFPVGVDVADYLPYRSGGVTQVRSPLTGGWEMVAYSDMEHTGFTVAVVLDSAQYTARLGAFLRITLLTFAPIIAVFSVVAYYTNRRISSPLTDMYGILSTVDFKEEGWRKTLQLPDSGIWEIDVLRDSIDQFHQQLSASTGKLMLLQKQELQSQMLALQSQMNPHFLYNSLSTISAMAEEGLNGEIGDMCENITTILRYISSNKRPFVRLEEEMETSSIYLNSLALRFGESLGFRFHIPDDMLDIHIPKLAVQLLVENAVKYTVPNQPPWAIDVSGATDGNIWCVEIADNGPGLSPGNLAALEAKMEEIDRSSLLPSLELSGMGLMNIYVRLRLLYGNAYIFRICNRQGGGASITIGGRVRREDSPL